MRRALPAVAVALAAFAAVLAIVTFATHGSASATAPTPVTPPPPQDPPIIDQRITATDLVSVSDMSADDVAILKVLGLRPDDKLVAVQGRSAVVRYALNTALMQTAMDGVETLYLEVERGGKPLLVRDHIEGDVATLLRTKLAPTYPPVPALPPPPADPRLAGITQIDAANVEVPEKVRDAVIADPSLLDHVARVVPSIKNGQPNGLKVYAIRPSSLLALLGFQNGDTVQTINGTALLTTDQIAGLVSKPKQLVFDGTRRGQPFRLTITITR